MSSSVILTGVRRLRSLLAARDRQDESDEQLLLAFLDRRDDGAFAVLVRRYGPLVLHVCRRVLGHEQDAEDAFQAVFLVLAQNVASLRNKTSLASYLHGTAYRTAMKAKQSAARRRKYENSARERLQPRSPADPVDELSWREVRTLLDEEITRLPEIYRSVFVLCGLENASREEAAERLRLKPGTVANRLAEARKRLSRRLSRRGVELTAVLAAAAAMTPPVSALPMRLAASTIEAALAAAASEGMAGIVSASVADLVRGATAAMMVNKTKCTTMILLAVTLLGGAGVCFLTSPQRQQALPVPALRAGKQIAVAPHSAKHESANTVQIRGRVLDPDGKPKPGAKLLLLSSKGKITPLGDSAEDGGFAVAVPKEAMKEWDHWLIAQAGGAGIDFLDLYQFKSKKPTELRLVKDNAIRGRVINTEGKPIRGVRVAVQSIEVYRNNSLDTFRAAWIKLYAGGAGTDLDRQIYSGLGALFSTTTDGDGRFVLQGMGAERTIRLRLGGAGIADTSVWVANRTGLDPKPFNRVLLDHTAKGHLNYRWSILSGPDVSVAAEAEKVIRGVVSDVDTGKGQPGVMVRLTRDSDELVHFPPEAKTDAQGRYEIHGVRKTKRYLLAVDGNKETGHMPSHVWAEDTVAHQPIRADIKVKKGVIVTGKIIDGATGEALPGFVMAAILSGNTFAKDYPKLDAGATMAQWDSADRTDAGHAFRIVTIPGPTLLMGKTRGTDRAVYKYKGSDPEYPQYFTDSGDCYNGNRGMAPLQGIWNKVLEIEPGATVVKQDIVLEREKILAEVRIQDAEGRPLTGAWTATDDPQCGVSFAPHSSRAESSSRLVYGKMPNKPLRILFYEPARRLTGTLILKGEQKQPAIVKLGPAGAIEGRLVDGDGKPLADMVVELRYRDRTAQAIHFDVQHHEGRGPILTDAAGAFAYDDIIPGMKFELLCRPNKRRSESKEKPIGAAVQVESGERRDLGAIRAKLMVSFRSPALRGNESECGEDFFR